VPPDVQGRIGELLQTAYAGFIDCHFSEKLRELEETRLHVSRATVRRIRRAPGPAPEAAMGAMIQVDATAGGEFWLPLTPRAVAASREDALAVEPGGYWAKTTAAVWLLRQNSSCSFGQSGREWVSMTGQGVTGVKTRSGANRDHLHFFHRQSDSRE
jgi:hypothetical protein